MSPWTRRTASLPTRTVIPAIVSSFAALQLLDGDVYCSLGCPSGFLNPNVLLRVQCNHLDELSAALMLHVYALNLSIQRRVSVERTQFTRNMSTGASVLVIVSLLLDQKIRRIRISPLRRCFVLEPAAIPVMKFAPYDFSVVVVQCLLVRGLMYFSFDHRRILAGCFEQ